MIKVLGSIVKLFTPSSDYGTNEMIKNMIVIFRTLMKEISHYMILKNSKIKSWFDLPFLKMGYHLS